MPYILEKIVEKIVIMPQIVECLKYVHEIVEQETLGVAVGVDIRTQEAKYQELYGKVKPQFEIILVELRKLRSSNPALKVQIDMIETFLAELSRLIAFPKIVQVEKEKIVEKDKNVPVLVPTLDINAERFQVTLSMIVGKLVDELMRVQKAHPNVNFNIDGEILKIFSNQYREKSGILNFKDGGLSQNLHRVFGFYDNFLDSLGGASLSQQQSLLFCAALEERLTLTTLIEEANLEISKAKQISDNRAEAFNIVLQSYNDLLSKFGGLEQTIVSISSGDSGRAKDQIDQIRGVLNLGLTSLQKFGSI